MSIVTIICLIIILFCSLVQIGSCLYSWLAYWRYYNEYKKLEQELDKELKEFDKELNNGKK